jgi:hypothetical protein
VPRQPDSLRRSVAAACRRPVRRTLSRGTHTPGKGTSFSSRSSPAKTQTRLAPGRCCATNGSAGCSSSTTATRHSRAKPRHAALPPRPRSARRSRSPIRLSKNSHAQVTHATRSSSSYRSGRTIATPVTAAMVGLRPGKPPNPPSAEFFDHTPSRLAELRRSARIFEKGASFLQPQNRRRWDQPIKTRPTGGRIEPAEGQICLLWLTLARPHPSSSTTATPHSSATPAMRRFRRAQPARRSRSPIRLSKNSYVQVTRATHSSSSYPKRSHDYHTFRRSHPRRIRTLIGYYLLRPSTLPIRLMFGLRRIIRSAEFFWPYGVNSRRELTNRLHTLLDE